jgi:hypothetical protein
MESLQDRVQGLTKENAMLHSQAAQLRDEILKLKTILLSHRDCKYFALLVTGFSLVLCSIPAAVMPGVTRKKKCWKY